MRSDVASIASRFCLPGASPTVVPVTSGHINDTYVLAATHNGQAVRHVLQRINHHVFTDPPRVMANIARITEHIGAKLAQRDPMLAARQVKVIPTRDGRAYHRDTNGNFWRVYTYVEDAATHNTVASEALAREAARMFGGFQDLLRDLPDPPLYETIRRFHDTPRRLEHFQRVVEEDPVNRAKTAAAEIDFVLEHAAICHVLTDLTQNGSLPIRIAHNDAKINNVMLDTRTGKGVCLIDLDTVMPGLSVHDFGDLVRTATCPAPEDERDLSKVAVDVTLFRALAEGFAQETCSWLTPRERSHLVFGGTLITFEQLIRFLTDYLAGDTYYKVRRPDHNLDRSRTQMKLVQSLIRREEVLTKLVEKIFTNVHPENIP